MKNFFNRYVVDTFTCVVGFVLFLLGYGYAMLPVLACGIAIMIVGAIRLYKKM